MSEVYWCDPALITTKIAPHFDLCGRTGGEWDIERRFPLLTNVKHLAIVQRFVEGRRWEDTVLFRDNYTRRLAGGGLVRGASTIEALAVRYYDRVDALFNALKRDGFRLSGNGKTYPLPALLIGRDGQVSIGSQGNHRLAMAQVLGLPRIAGEVVCWHSDWR